MNKKEMEELHDKAIVLTFVLAVLNTIGFAVSLLVWDAPIVAGACLVGVVLHLYWFWKFTQ